ncbi:MAG: ATP-binding cassette domain-containing protein [Methanobacterium sp.]|nr:ATP-binding cassette domain-containing protein [Methanobacterium sp.]
MFIIGNNSIRDIESARKILKNLNITIEEGAVLGILGRSGSGKSVLINMLRGMKDYRPNEGRILYIIAVCPGCLRVEPPSMAKKPCKCGCSYEVQKVDFWHSDRKLFAAIKRRISIMLQRTFALYEDDTVIDNVIKSITGHDEEESTYMAIDLLDMAQMTHRITHIARDLSGGEKQRVVLARQDPETVVQSFMDQVPLPEKKTEFKAGGPIIKMEGVKKHYYSIDRGVVKAVDGIDLVVDEGEIFGVVGLSGAGKTTLSRILYGLTDPSSGQIMVKLGDNWIDMTEKGIFGRGRVKPYLGILHQEYSLYPHRNVLGNLTEAISLELPAEFAKMKALYVLNAVGFDENYAEKIITKYPDELSGGERHRVALAQVLIKEPNIVILDEPTGTMDPITRVQVTDSIRKARDELKQTFLIISHDMDFVLDVCDRAALMRGGKILKTGLPRDIVEDLTPSEKEKMLKED